MCTERAVAVDPTECADSVTTAVVRAISDLEQCHPTELDFCLANYVDPDALEALFDAPETSQTTVTVHLDDYEVTVGSGDRVAVTQPCSSPATCAVAVIDG